MCLSRTLYSLVSTLILILFVSGQERVPSFKPYSGARVSQDSKRIVYHFEQTIAVVELTPKRILLNCELIEVVDDKQKRNELNRLYGIIGKPVQLKFPQMMDLTTRCSQLPITKMNISRETTDTGEQSDSPPSENNGLQVILPGTKWCGAGDLARNYYDLGSQATIDKCCRTHDICPVKVLGNSSRYGVNNTSPFTKSHCNCDAALKRCLKKENHSISNLMGQVYFNILQVQCVSGNVTNLQVKNPTPF